MPEVTRADRAIYPSLAGKSVFITGGSTGIGAELVAHFARQGAKVAFCDKDERGGRALVERLPGLPDPVRFYPCDVTDVGALQAAIHAAVAAQGPIAVLINNVADDDRHDLADVTVASFDWEVAVNLRPHVFAIQAVVPGMRERGGGAIINLGSIAWMNKAERLPVYATLKSASLGLTRSLAKTLGRDNIRINHLMPGWTITEKQERLWLDAAGKREILDNQCLAGYVRANDIAAMALFLAADDSRMITAQSFVVDGGWL